FSPGGESGEINDDVGPFGRPYQQAIELHRRGQEAAVGANLPEWQSVSSQFQDEESRVAAVDEAETIAPLLDVEVRPCSAVDHHGVAEELRIPNRRHVARTAAAGLGDERDLQLAEVKAFEERPVVGIEQRAVGIERAI